MRSMTFEQLKEKAACLPLAPGVYIMKDKAETVIYIGKAQKLKNRVSQYFVDTVTHSPKTRMMVSKVSDFDVIVAASEFEALILECSLIKRHMPKYNILLRMTKGILICAWTCGNGIQRLHWRIKLAMTVQAIMDPLAAVELPMRFWKPFVIA